MSRQIEFRDALNEAMSEEMRRDQRVFLLGEEVVFAYHNSPFCGRVDSHVAGVALSHWCIQDELGVQEIRCSHMQSARRCQACQLHNIQTKQTYINNKK